MAKVNEWAIAFEPGANVFLVRRFQFGECVREEPAQTLDDAMRLVAMHTGATVVIKVLTRDDE